MKTMQLEANYLSALSSFGPSKIYRRDTISGLPKTSNGSLRYWRSQARAIFERFPSVTLVECVTNGNKISSQIVNRGIDATPPGTVVIVASTGGKWGKSRREYGNLEDKSIDQIRA